MRIVGTLASVERGEAGTAVVGDYAASSTVLEIANPVDLMTDADPSIGRVIIGDLDAGDEYDYTLDTEAFTITVTPPLVSAVDDGDPVVLVPTRQTIVAYVSLPGGGELVTASVAHALTASSAFEVNDYADGAGPTVEMERIGDTYVIVDVPGQQVNISTSDTTIATARSGLRTQLDAIGLRTFNADDDETARLSAETGGMRLGGSLEVEGAIINPHSSEPVDMVHEDGQIKLLRRGDGSLIARIQYEIIGDREVLFIASNDQVGISGGRRLTLWTDGEVGGIPGTGGEIMLHGGVGSFIIVGDPDWAPYRPRVIFHSDAYFVGTGTGANGRLFVGTPTSPSHAANKAYADALLTNVPTPTNPNDAANKAYVDANAGGGGSAVEYVTVSRANGDQSIPNGVSSPTVVDFDTLHANSGLAWNFAGDRFIVPSGKAGLYEMTLSIAWRGNANGTRWAGIYINGNSTPTMQTRTNPPGASVFTQFVGSDPLQLSVGDYIDFRVAKDGGGSLNLVGSTDYLTKAVVKRIGD